MNNSAAETSLASEMLRQVDRIVIARKLGEVDDVFIFDRLANCRAHADRKIFEVERLKEWSLHCGTRTEIGQKDKLAIPKGSRKPRRRLRSEL